MKKQNRLTAFLMASVISVADIPTTWEEILKSKISCALNRIKRKLTSPFSGMSASFFKQQHQNVLLYVSDISRFAILRESGPLCGSAFILISSRFIMQ